MEIRPDEITKSKSKPLELFYSSIRAEATRKDYERKLKKVLCEFFAPILKGDPKLVQEDKTRYKTKSRGVKRTFSDADFEARATEFVRRAAENPDWAEDLMLKLGEKFKKRSELPKTDSNYINPVSLKNYFVPIQKLLEMNRVTLSWKRIRCTLPELDHQDDTREYTYSEIQKMLHHSKLIDRVLILLAASSGIRAGAFSIKWKHLVPIYLYNENYLWDVQDVTESVQKEGKVVAAMIRIYANSSSEYVAFITPECWHTIESYRQLWRQETNKEPKPDDPFFKRSGPFPRELTEMGIRKRLERVLKESGIRTPLPQGKRRYDVPTFNGFRRFFNKANKKSLSKNSVLASLILKETMMGHAGLIKLDKNYFKAHVSELIEEYLNAVPNLTISDEFRLRAENSRLQQERDSNKTDAETIDKLWDNILELQFEVKSLRASAQTKSNDELQERIQNLKSKKEKLDSLK
ncbi:MAG: integrase [Nitrosopumilus sp.]|nr:integrase [Nitrosopumilus sp.]